MSANRKTLLCRYHYDPLDRLADCTPSAQARTQRFYLKERLTSEIQGSVQRSIFQQDDQLLAQQQRQDGVIESTLLATDQQRSVLHALDATQPHPLAYTPYGHRPAENGLLSLLGFNGERPDPVTGHYLLGNGYRALNPVLKRFNSPDNLSPFGEGGLNAYGYCQGDPINRSDPSGYFSFGLGNFFSRLRVAYKSNVAGYPVKRTSNITRLSEEIYAWTDISKGKKRLTIQGHATGKPPRMKADNQTGINAADLYELALSKDLPVEKYDSFRIAMCYSGNQTIMPDGQVIPSFGEQFSKITGRPVKAFQGTLSGDDASKWFSNLSIGESSKRVKYFGFRKKNSTYNPIIYGREIRAS
jgi:RHS repeat-associated protein